MSRWRTIQSMSRWRTIQSMSRWCTIQSMSRKRTMQSMSRWCTIQSMSRWRISYNQTIHHSVQLSTIDISQIINKDTINRFFTHLCPNKRVNWYVAYCQQRRRRLLITKEASLHYIMNLCMVPLTTEDRRAPTRSNMVYLPVRVCLFLYQEELEKRSLFLFFCLFLFWYKNSGSSTPMVGYPILFWVLSVFCHSLV